MACFGLSGLILVVALLPASRETLAAPPAPGEMARPFTLPDLQDRPVSLSSFRGRLVLLHFWATWCPTCREEMGLLEEAARAHPESLVILGINLGEKRSRVQTYVKEAGITFPILRDARGKVAAAYDVLSLPITLVVSPEGRIVDSVVMGALVRGEVERILARHAPH